MKMKVNKMLALPLIVSLMAACNNGERTTETNDTTVITETTVEKQATPSATGWEGTYKGTVPCASCPGIETTVVLKSDSTYEMTENYLEEKNGKFTSNGKIEWKDAQNIALNSKDGQRLFKVADGTLTMLDGDGKEATGDLAAQYMLKKTN